MDQNGVKVDESERLEQTNKKLQEVEQTLNVSRKELMTYQNMLEQSQNQYTALEKKYNKAKQLVREFHQRELDLLHREDFYQQLLQEKDTEYNALVKNLKDRIIALEQNLLETQRKAGVPMVLPYDSISLKQLTPQMSRRQPPKLLFQRLEPDFSDTEISDTSPEEGGKTATVERKLPIKEEFDRAVPPHELLDISANKSKAELANRGALANRQLPSGKKGSLSNSSSDYGLDESYNSGDELTDSAFSPNDSIRKKPDTVPSIKPATLSARNYMQQFQSEAQMTQTIHYSVQNVQYTAVQKPGQQHTIPDQNSSAVYARVQKDSSALQHSSPDPWVSGSNKGVNIGLGPPPSLAEQLKQVKRRQSSCVVVKLTGCLCRCWRNEKSAPVVIVCQIPQMI